MLPQGVEIAGIRHANETMLALLAIATPSRRAID